MNSNNCKIQPIRPDLPVYSISAAADLLDIQPQTLRHYKDEGLIKSETNARKMMFSQNDVSWTRCLQSMIHDKDMSTPGLKKLLQLVPCWEMADCPSEIHTNCTARVNWATPRTLHLIGEGAVPQQTETAQQPRQNSTQLRSVR